MERKARISFIIQPFEGTLAVTPIIDETPLPQMIAAFERDQHFEPAGGYGGLIPAWFKYGPLDRYFMGDFDEDSHFAHMDRVYLLACECGEVGCWPLMARIKVGDESVKWDSFQQPHRKERDYTGFGSFIFDARQYRDAVAALSSPKLTW